MRLVNWRSLATAAAGFALAACGDDVTVTPTPITFTTNPPAVSCVAGTTSAVGLSVAGGTGTPTVTFQGTGSGFTVAGTGTSATITCSAAGAGAVNFTITSGNQTVTGSIPVTVTAAPQPTSPVTAVVINPTSLTLVPGGSGQLTASVTLAPTAPAGTSTAVTWSSSDTTVATVNATGLVTTRAAAAGRSAVITAQSVANTNLRASAAVTVTAASALVQGLAVSPSAVNLSTGGTQQITSNVTLAAGAPAGTSTGVTYTSSDTSIARVSSTGLITAGSRTGVATITVASVAAPTVVQTIGVNVTSPAPVRLTIQGLTITNAQGNQVAADPTNVFGNLVATLNLDPGDFRPDSVVVTLGNFRTVCQRFSAQLVEAYRRALTDGSADVAPVQCVINTAAFDTLTGVARALNGQQQLNATVFYRPQGGGAATTQTATIGQNLTLNNTSGFYVQVTNTPTAAQRANGAPANGQATGPQGVLWRAGSLTVMAIPVNFTAATPGAGTGSTTLNVNLVDAQNAQIATRQASANAGQPFTVTFPGQTAAYTPVPNNTNAGCQCLDGYTSPNAGAANGGTQVQIGGAANTVFLNVSGVPQAGGPAIFIDNASPEARTQIVAATNVLGGVGTVGFINGSFSFTDSVTQAAPATALGDNNGVDRVSRSFFFLANSAGLDANAIVANGTTVTSGGQIPQNVSSNAYVAAARLVDALGNAANLPVTTAGNPNNLFTFGVVTAAPNATTVNTGNITSNAQIGASTTTTRTLTFNVSTSSGATFPVNPLIGTLSVLRPNGATICAVAADVNGNGQITGVSTTTAPPCPTISFREISMDPTTAPSGIYTLTAQARDVAGNVGPTFTRSFAVDRTPPSVINPTVPSAPLTGGAQEQLAATATDDFGLVAQLAAISYPTTVEILLRYTGTPLSTSPFGSPFVKSANLSVTVPFFVRGIAYQTPTAPGVGNCPAGAVAGSCFENVVNSSFTNANAAAIGANDQGANWAYAAFQPGFIANSLDQASSQAAPSLFTGNFAPTSLSLTFQASNATSATLGGLPATLNPATTGVPSSFTINLVQNAPANTPVTNQFARVEIWQRSSLPQPAPGTPALPFGVTNAYRLVGSCGGPVTSISNTASTITNTCTVTPGASLGGEVSFTGFPSAGNTNNVNLLVLATTANGHAVAFIIPQVAFTAP